MFSGTGDHKYISDGKNFNQGGHKVGLALELEK